MRDTTWEEAQNLVAHVVEQRARWGKHYDGSDVSVDKILDCLVVLAQHLTDSEKDLRESLTLANRQLSAAGAREVRQKKQIERLRNGDAETGDIQE